MTIQDEELWKTRAESRLSNVVGESRLRLYSPELTRIMRLPRQRALSSACRVLDGVWRHKAENESERCDVRVLLFEAAGQTASFDVGNNAGPPIVEIYSFEHPEVAYVFVLAHNSRAGASLSFLAWNLSTGTLADLGQIGADEDVGLCFRLDSGRRPLVTIHGLAPADRERNVASVESLEREVPFEIQLAR